MMHNSGGQIMSASSLSESTRTLDYAALERMISLDAKLPKASLVGFNFIVEKPRLRLKERLLAGEFGPLQGATLTVWFRLLKPVLASHTVLLASWIAYSGRLRRLLIGSGRFSITL